MNIRIVGILAILLINLAGCATATGQSSGPGMTVTFINVIKGKKVSVIEGASAGGIRLASPGSLSPNSRPLTNGKIMIEGGKTFGAAPDGRGLPEWVEFKWQELPHPGQKMPTEPEALQAWRDNVHALYASLPVRTGRIAVRERVPQSVIDEVIESNRKRERGKVPEKMLWVYFIWAESGVKFRWELKERGRPTVQVGGDDVDGG